uniref:Uncharacterized protein n=1 Tax=Trichobilharzia regenti TaxID=157069 RepID=A0AA85KET2_TRIRE|nr:unnamed protein product [Trichobilharzia regenti]
MNVQVVILVVVCGMCLTNGDILEYFKAHNWTSVETMPWLTNDSGLRESEYLFQKANISESFLPRLCVSSFVKAYNLDYMNSSHSILIQGFEIIFVGPPETDPGIYLLLGAHSLIVVWCTCLLTVHFLRLRHKPGLVSRDYDNLSESNKTLQVLERNLSSEIDSYESSSDSSITSYEDDDGGDGDNNGDPLLDTNTYMLNWDELTKSVIRSGAAGLLFSASTFSLFVSLLSESYFAELNYLRKEVSRTTEKLSRVENLRKQCQSVCSHNNNKRFMDYVNSVKVEMSDQKYELESFITRWNNILDAIRTVSLMFAESNDNGIHITTNSASSETIFSSLSDVTEDEQTAILPKDDSKGDIPSDQLVSQEYFVDNEIENCISVEMKSPTEIETTNDAAENRIHSSDGGVANISNEISHDENTEEQQPCSYLHVTKIPTLSSRSSISSETSPNMLTFGSSQIKRHSLSNSGSLLPSPSVVYIHPAECLNRTPLTDQDNSMHHFRVVSSDKQRTPFSNLNNASADAQHSRLPKPKYVNK